jgi:phosphoglycerate dehydrogenase-like enzyme
MTQRSRVTGGLVALAVSAQLGAFAGRVSAQAAAVPESPEAKAVIAEFRIEEGKTPVRQFPRWRAPKKILLSGTYTPAQLSEVKGLAPGAEFAVAPRDRAAMMAAIADADAFMGMCNNAELIAAGKELRWVKNGSACVEDCVTNPAFRGGKVLLTNQQHPDAPVIAEHVIALMLAVQRNLPGFVRAQEQGHWIAKSGSGQPITHVKGRTMLVVGLGGIGTDVAERAHGLGMKIVATRNTGHEGPSYISYVGLSSEMSKLAPDADVVVNCTPLTPETTSIFDAKFFAAMKKGAMFINVGRGKSVVTNDLVEALKSGQVGSAALDVTDPEPLPDGHPLWTFPNVLITPHAANLSDLKGENQWVIMKENIRRYAAGEKMLSVVNPKLRY